MPTDPDNDFAPPASDVTPPEPQPLKDYTLAKRDQRATGLVIDLLFSYPLMLVLILLLEILGLSPLLEIDLELGGLARFISWMIFLFAYYFICESAWNRTVGKMITGTRVVDVSGRGPSMPQILSRTFIRFIPLEFISYIDRQRPSGWHDQWSNTRVVNHTPEL